MSLREMSQLFYQIKLLDQKITQLFEHVTGFSLTRYEMVMEISQNNGCSQNRLQEHLQIDSAAVTRHLKVLEEKGYVTRKRNPENNREVLVHLTDKARKSIEKCHEHQTLLQKAIDESFTQSDLHQTVDLLRKLDDSLNTITEE
ncbi:MarR family transcriptional regulator [Granulicatella sp. zg-ZJ]|uniref:MarR family winged helix-turn-helix transcriptional regulator n=1 Tax=Granulicatella sp. zg-ZJ TaxID=2678504 RepID=UPI0013D83D67|nr:MarR family transcriptional regulator [Granulicatella sp. zg-ZJ]NEW63294.1 MarR family transcriptional regulator [Granulicatella sp. zg-ZJ]